MTGKIDFGAHAHRCLFWNDCVEAHLLGLKPECRCFEACFKQDATLVLTYGEACAKVAGEEHPLRAGEQIQVPQGCPMRISTSGEADVMLLLR